MFEPAKAAKIVLRCFACLLCLKLNTLLPEAEHIVA
jgi:hypothetical protein